MSEFQPINIADGEEESIVIKKTKKVKRLIIEDKEIIVFKKTKKVKRFIGEYVGKYKINM
jgi:hypothetical protein